MEIATFLRGMMIGISIAAPVGPISVLCIRRTLAEGRLAGCASGLGAACADAVYGSIAAFGLTSISGALVDQQDWMRLIGGGFLVYLGARTFFSKPAAVAPAGANGKKSLAGFFASTFFLTLTNPMTILSFAAIFAGLGLGMSSSRAGAAAVVGGVFCGSALWWLMVSSSIGFFRRFLNGPGKIWINRISGAIILTFGVIALAAYFL